MRTKTMKNHTNIIPSDLELSTEMKKVLALNLFNKEPFFFINGECFLGDHLETVEAAKDSDLLDYCRENLTEVNECDCTDESETDGKHIVLTDEEANEKAADYIKDSLWAFNADFIIQHSKLPFDAVDMVKSYQSDKCEGANDTIEALIEDMDDFISDAILADGRGHFMNTYDGCENEEQVQGETFYIYRIN